MNFKASRIVYSPAISLAMYKELAAHLSQVRGVKTNLDWQDNVVFNYDDSQIAAIWVSSGEDSQTIYPMVKAILDHYGSWYIQSEQVSPSVLSSKAIA